MIMITILASKTADYNNNDKYNKTIKITLTVNIAITITILASKTTDYKYNDNI